MNVYAEKEKKTVHHFSAPTSPCGHGETWLDNFSLRILTSPHSYCTVLYYSASTVVQLFGAMRPEVMFL